MIELVIKTIDKLGVSSEGNHVAIVTFGPTASIQNNFKKRKFHIKENLTRLVQKNFGVVPKEWGTRADIAEHRVATKLFTPKGGDRPSAKNVML